MSYILIEGCEIYRTSNSIKELRDYRREHNLRWAKIYKVVEQEDK